VPGFKTKLVFDVSSKSQPQAGFRIHQTYPFDVLRLTVQRIPGEPRKTGGSGYQGIPGEPRGYQGSLGDTRGA